MTSAESPRITFGIIVLNGEPFTAHTLRSLYPFAYEIIVVEGAAPAAAASATQDGHSSDGTLEVIRQFIAKEDVDRKVHLVTAMDEGHPDGFWPGEKDEQSRAYATRATGDYLWQVDIDEFYRPEDMATVRELLRKDSQVTGMSFRQIVFWGGLDYVVDGWHLRAGASDFHRLFKWGPGYTYARHRPPTILDDQGMDLRIGKWLTAAETARLGVRLYHFAFLFPKQVREKSDYYATAAWGPSARSRAWAEESYEGLRWPFHIHNVYRYPSWLERYRGPRIAEVDSMMTAVSVAGTIAVRRTDDIERLLRTPSYQGASALLRFLSPGFSFARRLRVSIRTARSRLTGRLIPS